MYEQIYDQPIIYHTVYGDFNSLNSSDESSETETDQEETETDQEETETDQEEIETDQEEKETDQEEKETDQEDVKEKKENPNNEKYESSVVVSDSLDYSNHFENLESIGLSVILILIAGFIGLSFAVGIKK